MNVIAIYDGYIFECKLGGNKLVKRKPDVAYLAKYSGSMDKTIRKYKKLYPNHSIQFYREGKRQLLSEVRYHVHEFMMNNAEFRIMYRENKINSLLDESEMCE